MSSDSLAILRRNTTSDSFDKLAKDHLEHDLTESDRDTLHSASQKLGTHVTVGSLLGLGLGAFFAFRVRQTRFRTFQAFRAAEKPTHVKFAGGREEPIPNLEPIMRPSTLGDVAAYLLFGSGGLFLGGETGLLTGTWSAGRTITRDTESRKRIESAFAKFRADVLRKEADALDGGKSVGDVLLPNLGS